MFKKIVMLLSVFLFVCMISVPGLAQVYGACCVSDPESGGTVCFEETVDGCASWGGTYLGDGTYCVNLDGNENNISDICEDVLGACCYGDGTCDFVNALDCQLAGGEYKGAGTDCYDDPEDEDEIAEVCEEAPTGACCLPWGQCRDEVTAEDCLNWEGTYIGDATQCSEGLCESLPGACCYGDGECVYVSQSECEGEPYNGEFKGVSTDCTDDPEDEDDIAEVCEEPVYGACCFVDPESQEVVCFNETLNDCNIWNGNYLGDGTYCIDYDGNENDTCDLCEDVLGACCYGDGSCGLAYALDCQLAGGEYKGAGTDCYEDPEDEDEIAEVCENPAGACCYGDSECAILTEDECDNEPYYGEFKGEGTDCYDDPEDVNEVAEICEGPTMGACCWNDGFSCWVMTESECVDEYDGDWKGEDTDCSDNNGNSTADICEESNTYEYLPGDANMSTGNWPPSTIGGDVTCLVNYFRGITAPCMLDGFYASADANGSCSVTGADVTKLVSYFRGMDDLNYCQDYPTTWPPIPDTAPDGWPNCSSPILSK